MPAVGAVQGDWESVYRSGGAQRPMGRPIQESHHNIEVNISQRVPITEAPRRGAIKQAVSSKYLIVSK